MRRMSPCCTAALLRRAVIRASSRHARRPLRRSALLLPPSRATVLRSASRPPLARGGARGGVQCSADVPDYLPASWCALRVPAVQPPHHLRALYNPALCPLPSSGPLIWVRPCGSAEQPHPWGQHPVPPLPLSLIPLALLRFSLSPHAQLRPSSSFLRHHACAESRARGTDRKPLGPRLEWSAEEAVRQQLCALQSNDDPYPDHGVEVMYRFAGFDPFERSRYFGPRFDLGQFERFRRLFHHTHYRVLLSHKRHHLLSSFYVSPARVKQRVEVEGVRPGEVEVFEFTLEQVGRGVGTPVHTAHGGSWGPGGAGGKDPPPPSPSPTPSTVRVSVGPPSASSTPKRARNGKWAQSTLVVGRRRFPPPDNDKPADPPPKEAQQPEEVDIPVRADTGSPALTKMQLREQVYLEASINYETKWSKHFSWLVFGKTKDGFPYVKCSICMSYAKGNTRYAMQGDDGGRDLQTQSFRAHEHTDAHKAAVDRQLKRAAGIREGRQAISDFINSDVEGRRAIRLMREALAVKDAAESNEDLGMVDKVVRTVATLLGNSSVWSQRFKYLQRVIYQTNLEVQGIHTVRWLSRGDAVRRLCKVLGACIVLLWEHNLKAYEIVTCYKFQFCLFFLADILADMNDLNCCFQSRELDVTEISNTIEFTTGDLTERYLTTNKPFGGEGKSWLVNFLKVLKEGGGKQVRVRGVDGEGRPINHLYTMHERKLKGHKQGSTYADCVKLCRQFARDCVDNLNERLDDLGKLGPTKLFRAGKWPKIKAQREKKCKEWLHGCSRLFRHKLPGFDLKAAERELPTSCAIMESHHEMESFGQGLNNFLGSVDSKR
ncbi:unnamed protein product [Closterium sp. Naga37s-1]|nr:unnamed protein product [Closterium sp. Naga37s-1]